MPARSARIVLVSDRGRVALIRRRRAGQDYWSFPGGGIKRGERPDRAARRELLEELRLDVRPQRLLAVASGHALFLATIIGEPALHMHGPEVSRRSRRGRYRPEWVPLDRLPDLDVRPRTARVALASLTAATAPATTAPATPPVPPPADPSPVALQPVEPLPVALQPVEPQPEAPVERWPAPRRVPARRGALSRWWRRRRQAAGRR